VNHGHQAAQRTQAGPSADKPKHLCAKAIQLPTHRRQLAPGLDRPPVNLLEVARQLSERVLRFSQVSLDAQCYRELLISSHQDSKPLRKALASLPPAIPNITDRTLRACSRRSAACA
ncbi:hypothetical protein, partial [Pseudomonas aeruginosa]|uniref:hypothetical protein n=1 Tax=Pseudomonas aeruginosa TaxID=287 RepID=UPI001C4E703D